MNRLCACVLAVALTALAVPSAAANGPADAPAAVARGVASLLETRYVLPAAGRRAADVLRANAAAGTYAGLTQKALAQRLTADLAPILHDKHVRVSYSETVLPPEGPDDATPSAAQAAEFDRFMRERGYGARRIAHLPGNVAYLDLSMFADPGPAADTVVDGFVDAVAYSDVVILDLRRNGGGSAEMVARVLSHFLPPGTHVNDFVGRGDRDAKVEESTYTTAVPGPRIGVPLYVLTSSRTFSGAEECAYDVQALHRGVVVGETTGGAANPGGFRRIDDHFEVFVPTKRARNPITGTNWEGVGVKPDRDVAADRALATAYALALASLPPQTDADARAQLRDIVTKLASMDDAAILAL